jgi:hypothetical protein
MNRRAGITRRIGTGLLAAALALAIAPTLTGCFGIDKIVEGATGGGVSAGSLPEGFPAEVPVVEGDILLGIAVGEEGSKVYNVTVKTSGDAAETIRGQLTGAGFTEQTTAQMTTDKGQSLMFTDDTWGVLVVVGQSSGDWTANYTVTQVTGGN